MRNNRRIENDAKQKSGFTRENRGGQGRNSEKKVEKNFDGRAKKNQPKNVEKKQKDRPENNRKNYEGSNHRSSNNNHRSFNKNNRRPRKKAENIKIIPIGGLDEIGKNMTAFEYKDQIVILDCGMSFPDDEMFGVDVVIPEFSYLIENMEKIKGIIITHGHEDHIGAIPYFLKKVNVPIYGTRLPLGLINNKLQEHGIQADLRPVSDGDSFRLGDFNIEAIRTTHSIADAVAYLIETPAARIFHTGDFKIDYTPVDGKPIDFAKLAMIGNKGVDLLMADSTNALRKGYTPSERVVGETLEEIFRKPRKRIIIATFSSNVQRVQKIIELSVKNGRKFVVSGRSMENVVRLAVELGYIKFPEGSMVDLKNIRNIPDNKLTIITTGSQGEPMSALSRMAAGEHRNIKLKKGDTVILSSTPVPGNEKTVSAVVNKLFEKEVDVIYNDNANIHVSGHAFQEDLKLIHSLIRPRIFMPVHGEHRHLVMHARLAEDLGMKKDNIFILSNGDQLTLDRRRAVKFKNVVNSGDVMVDGLGIGDVGSIVLKDRKMLSESGLIIVVAAVDTAGGYIVSGPEIVSRGFVYVKEHEELIAGMRKTARKAIEASLDNGFVDWNTLKNDVRDSLRKSIFKKTRRSPLILPIFLNI